MDLAGRLKELRVVLNLSQKEMARHCSISVQMWQAYESGASKPGGKVLELLARMMTEHGYLSLNWLLADYGPMWLTETALRVLVVEEAHTSLRMELNAKRKSHQLDQFLGGLPTDAKISSEQLSAYIAGKYKPTKLQLKQLCQLAGGNFKQPNYFETLATSVSDSANGPSQLNAHLLELIIDVIAEIDEENRDKPMIDKGRLIAFTYEMNRDREYTKENIKKFLKAIHVFIEHGLDFKMILLALEGEKYGSDSSTEG